MYSALFLILGALLPTGRCFEDSIYINEYIMGTFKNSVPVLVDGAGTVRIQICTESRKRKSKLFTTVKSNTYSMASLHRK